MAKPSRRGRGAITIEELSPEHWAGVARVYAEGIATGDATFETEVPSWEAWDTSHLADHRLSLLLCVLAK